MNYNDARDVINTFINIVHDAFDIMVLVENETLILRATGEYNNDFEMRWTYKGYGNERVRQISTEYSHELMLRQREQGSRL